MPKLEPVELDFLERAEIEVSTEVDLPASIEEVWSVLVDNDSWIHWFSGCRSMVSSVPVWSEAGDTRTIGVDVFKIEEVAVAIDESTRWAMCLTKTNLPMAKRMLEVLDLSDTSRNGEVRTEVRWTGAIDPLTYLRPFTAVLQRRLVNTWGRSLEALHDEVVSRRP